MMIHRQSLAPIPHCASQRTRRNMRGATLIEVLVAFLLLAFGILGLSGLQINALKNNQISLQRSQASMLACFLMDSMRANRKAAINGDYNLGEINKSAKTHAAICSAPTGTALVGNDHARWFDALKLALGNEKTTCAAVACDSNGNCDIIIEWQDNRTSITSQQQQIFSFTSRL